MSHFEIRISWLAKQGILFSHVFLKNRVTELCIKKWWLAEQIGAHRKIVIRWLQGQVRSIQHKFAKTLDYPFQVLFLTNEAEQLAAPKDQKTAAKLLAQSSLIDKLGPIEE